MSKKNQILIISDKIFGLKTTADDVASELKKQKASFVFLSIDDILDKKDTLSVKYSGKKNKIIFKKKNKLIDIEKIGSVFNWRPKSFKLCKKPKGLLQEEYDFIAIQWEKFLSGIFLHLKDRFCVNPYPENRFTEEKAYQLMLAQETGFKVPYSFLSTSLKETALAFKDIKSDIIYKPFYCPSIPVKTESGKTKKSIIFTSVIDRKDLKCEPKHIAPNIFQEYVPKKREIRITVAGKNVFAAEVDSQSNIDAKHDWRKAGTDILFEKHELPKGISNKCFTLMRKLGLNYCTIDMVLTPKNEYVFLELNPTGQYGWIEEMTKMPITKNLARMLIEGTVNYKPFIK